MRSRAVRKLRLVYAVSFFIVLLALAGAIFYINFGPGWHNKKEGRCYYQSFHKVIGLQKIGGKQYIFSDEGYLLEGLVEIDGKIYYSTRFGIALGDCEIGGVIYHFDDLSGILYTGLYTLDGRIYCRNQQGIVEAGLISVNGSEYLVAADGQVAHGWQEFDGAKYYFSEDDGTMLHGHITVDGKDYVLAEDGKLCFGIVEEDGKRFYAEEQCGELITGFEKIGDTLYYFESDGTKDNGVFSLEGCTWYLKEGICEMGFLSFDGKKVYQTEHGFATGFLEIENQWYCFDENGVMYTGWLKVNDTMCYYDVNGVKHIGWLELDSKVYYLDSEGNLLTGEHAIQGKRYRFEDNGELLQGFVETEVGKQYYERGFIKTGITQVGSDYYYLSSEGVPTGGTRTLDGVFYSFDTDGKAVTGWSTIDGKVYYFESKGNAVTGKVAIDGAYYYFDKNGQPLSDGWHEISSGRFYTDKDGEMKLGLSTVSGNTYYFNQEGFLQTGWLKVDGKLRYFDTNGVMAKNTVMGTYSIDENGVAKNRFAVITEDNLDDYLDYVVETEGSDLASLFDFVRENVPTYQYSAKKSERELAIDALNYGKGACWHYASLMKLLAEAAGYDAMVIVGKGHTASEHNWTLIKTNTGWRHFDCMRMARKVSFMTDAQLKAIMYDYSWGTASYYRWDASAYPAAN